MIAGYTFLLAMLVATAAADHGSDHHSTDDDDIAARLGNNVQYRPGECSPIAFVIHFNYCRLLLAFSPLDLVQIHVWKVGSISMKQNQSLKQKDMSHVVSGRILLAAHQNSLRH